MAKRSKDGDSQTDLLRQEREVEELLRTVPPETLGARLCRARKRQGLSIRDLAAKANVNKNSIVRLENGGLPQALTILKICAAMSIHVATLAKPAPGESEVIAIHRHGDDRWYDLTDFGAGSFTDRREMVRQGVAVPMLPHRSRLETGLILPSVLELYGESQTRSHLGEEMVYVLSGKALVTVGDQTYELSEGESATFWSSEQHKYAPAKGEKLPVRILCVILHQGAGGKDITDL